MCFSFVQCSKTFSGKSKQMEMSNTIHTLVIVAMSVDSLYRLALKETWCLEQKSRYDEGSGYQSAYLSFMP